MTKTVLPRTLAINIVTLLHAEAQGASPQPNQSPPTPQMRIYVSGQGSDANFSNDAVGIAAHQVAIVHASQSTAMENGTV